MHDANPRRTRPWWLGATLAIGALVPGTVQADWHQLTNTVIDPEIEVAPRIDMDFVVTSGAWGGFDVPTKFQGLAYIDRTNKVVRYAYRVVEAESSLVGEPWTIEVASDPGVGASTEPPDLAIDRETGAPYIVYRDDLGLPRISWWVGPGQGTCGTGNAWVCVDVSIACDPSSDSGPIRVELSNEYGQPADIVHVLSFKKNRLLDSRINFALGHWECKHRWTDADPIAPYVSSTVIADKYGGRVRPQLVRDFANGGFGANYRALEPEFMGGSTTLWSWESNIDAKRWMRLPSMARHDMGMFAGDPVAEGWGVPAVVAVNVGTMALDEDGGRQCGPDGTWSLEYREAETPYQGPWTTPEAFAEGQPCWPSLAMGPLNVPYVAYGDQATSSVRLAVGHPYAGWYSDWIMSGDHPSITYDFTNYGQVYDVITIASADSFFPTGIRIIEGSTSLI